MSESKAGFSHGAIPRNPLMQPRSGGSAGAVPRLHSPPAASCGTENEAARANRPSQIPVCPVTELLWGHLAPWSHNVEGCLATKVLLQ